MKKGLLWFDESTETSLIDKVQAGAKRYEEKFGAPPNVCRVSPAAMEQARMLVGSIEVLAARNIQPHHFWIGIAETPA